MGRPGGQPTNVYNSDALFDAQGLRYARIVGGDWKDATGALKAGKALQICVSYGVVYDLQPLKSGSPTFRGGHSIYIQELRRNRRGEKVTLSGDSLFDGRRAGIPKGFKWVRVETYRRATQAFAGRSGLWWGGIVPPHRGYVAGPGHEGGWHEEEEPVSRISPLSTRMRSRPTVTRCRWGLLARTSTIAISTTMMTTRIWSPYPKMRTTMTDQQKQRTGVDVEVERDETQVVGGEAETDVDVDIEKKDDDAPSPEDAP